MRYLLDTHIWLWSLLEPDRIGAHVLAILQDDDNELFISPITVWETMILAERGKLSFIQHLKNGLRKPWKEVLLWKPSSPMQLLSKVGESNFLIKIQPTALSRQRHGNMA